MVCAFIAAVVLSLVCSAAIAAEPKRVLLLHSFGRDFKPWSDYARAIRTELERQSPWPLDIVDHSLIAARSGNDDSERPFVDYLRALYTSRPVDLIVSIGAPAAAFVQRHRHDIFPAVPMVLTAVEQRRVDFSKLTDNDVAVSVRIDYRAAFENILHVLPDTARIAVVVGASPIEKFWREEIAREVKPVVDGKVAVTWYDTLSFEDILKDAAALPPKTALFWELMIVDAAGVVHEGDGAMTRLHAVANAPLFSFDDSFFGRELVGGPMLSVLEGGRKTAEIAVRVLGGEKPGGIRPPPIEFAAPKFDWREMQRWDIREANLPPGSTVLFRTPSILEQYRWPIIAAGLAMALQAIIIAGLLYEHRRRREAEMMVRNTMIEMAQMNRIATAGELSASIAHEVRQPLATVVAYAHAALNWLAPERQNVGEARHSLDEIIKAGHRANDVLTGVRAMFGKDTGERGPVDINALIRTVFALVEIDLQKNGIALRTQLGNDVPPVDGNRIQLQQLVLNLVINAIDAMKATPRRELRVTTSRVARGAVQISIEDTGTGIDPAHLGQVFQPRFTTKAASMGMGLAICQSIAHGHDGRIDVSAAPQGGSVFRIELPIKAGGRPAAEPDVSPN